MQTVLTLPLAVDEAVPLAHALVADVAEREGVRALFIKGPISRALGLRPAGTSSDVDVLVDPAERPRLIEALRRRGWHERPIQSEARVYPAHAIHLINDTWPCDVDVHDRYPGLFASRATVFEALWQTRTTVEVAARPIPCPDAIGCMVIGAAHSLRDPRRDRSERELTHLVEFARHNFDEADRARLADLVAECRASETLHPFTERIGIDTPTQDLSRSERREWRMRTSDPTRVFGWLVTLTNSPWPRRPLLIWQLMFPPEQQFRSEHPQTPEGRLALIRAQFTRIGRAVRSVTRGAIGYRRAKSSG